MNKVPSVRIFRKHRSTIKEEAALKTAPLIDIILELCVMLQSMSVSQFRISAFPDLLPRPYSALVFGLHFFGFLGFLGFLLGLFFHFRSQLSAHALMPCCEGQEQLVLLINL